jgi:hypothetical protein
VQLIEAGPNRACGTTRDLKPQFEQERLRRDRQDCIALIACAIELDFGKPKLAERASATATDVQLFVELFIQLLLLGIEYRHIPLLNLFRRRTRWKLLGAGLQVADRRVAIHRHPGASDGGRIAGIA